MQIRQINTAVNQRIKTKSNKNNQPQKIHYVDTVSVNKNQSFKGLGGSSLLTLVKNSLDRFALFIANAIENGGLVVSFTLQDMIGTNLPRPIMGLKRNSKENKGEKNLKFAAKELTREMLTGPSMFAIPAAIIAVGKKALGKTFDVPMQFIKGFGAIHADKPLEAGKAITKEVFYKNTFAEMLKNANVPEADIPEKAKEFADKLTQALKKQATRKETKAERNKIINNLC